MKYRYYQYSAAGLNKVASKEVKLLGLITVSAISQEGLAQGAGSVRVQICVR